MGLTIKQADRVNKLAERLAILDNKIPSTQLNNLINKYNLGLTDSSVLFILVDKLETEFPEGEPITLIDDFIKSLYLNDQYPTTVFSNLQPLEYSHIEYLRTHLQADAEKYFNIKIITIDFLMMRYQRVIVTGYLNKP